MSQKRKCIGWRCTHCNEGRFFGDSVTTAGLAAQHVREKHLTLYHTGRWVVVPIYSRDAKREDNKK